jgi:hypothetical protein
MERAQRLIAAKNGNNEATKNGKASDDGNKEEKRKYNLAKIECQVLR